MKYFTIEELTRSSTAMRHGIDNTPDEDARRNLVTLTECLLDPLRELWGAPLIVTSGYRCRVLNRIVGGVSNSHHLCGMAADLVTKTNTLEENRCLFDVLQKASGLRWTQAIWERSRNGTTWVHVSYDPNGLKCQVIDA